MTARLLAYGVGLAALVIAVATVVSASAAPRDAALRAYLQRALGPASDTPNTSIKTAWTDLNGDGRPEALVYVFGPERCGSGGCDLLILERTAEGFRRRGDISVTRFPVGILRTRTDGWRHISVRVGGGGIINGYSAEVPFRNGHYASNPTVAPARRLASAVEPAVIMTGNEKSERLFAPTR